MGKMRAARLHEPGKPFRIDEIDIPEPRPGDVQVKVRACGIIPNMNAIVSGKFWHHLAPMPAAMGLDAAGTVARAPAGRADVAEGDRVYVNPFLNCGECHYCRAGTPLLCADAALRGYFGFTPRGARLLEEMLEPERPVWDKADEIKEVEHKCDFLTHEIIQRLNRTFVTPLDREDIHALARSLDDVMDAIDASATLVRLYRLDSVRFGARELARIISACTDQVHLGLTALEQSKGLAGPAIEINRLENEADRVHQQAVTMLFDDERDPIVVMKWKEALDFLEDATDRCEDVANVLEGVMVKHG